MRCIFLSLAIGLLAVACAYDDIPFERMSFEELAAYNADRPLAQMIVCSDGTRSFSRVKRRRCLTVEHLYGSESQAQQLDVLNSVPGYSNGDF